MRILLACERSGLTREAFRKLGHDAWSCDLEDAEDGSPFHIKHDAIEVAYYNGGGYWDQMIAHPECTWLATSGIHRNYSGRQGLTPEECWLKTEDALAFAMKLANAPIDKICIENPQSILSTRWRKRDQQIQPYEFGDDASKRTWLWLKNLTPLVIDPALRFPGRWVVNPETGKLVERWSNQTDSGQNRLGPSIQRAINRARTYPGISNAFAINWGMPVVHSLQIAS